MRRNVRTRSDARLGILFALGTSAAAAADGPPVMEELMSRIEETVSAFADTRSSSGEAPEVRVDGMEGEPGVRGLEAALERALETEDFEALFEAFASRDMTLDADATGEGLVVLEVVEVTVPDEEFHRELTSGDVDAVAARLASGTVDLDAPLDLGDSVLAPPMPLAPLTWAIEPGRAELVRLLLDAGADPDGVDGGMRPLFSAIGGADAAVARVLLEGGAELGPVEAGGFIGSSMLGHVVERNEPELLELLLEHGADPDAVDRYGWTPLMDALHLGRTAMIETLLPVSDPRMRSERVDEHHVLKDLDVPSYPPANALLVARRSGPDARAWIEPLLARAAELGGEEAVQLVTLQAALGEADLARAQGLQERTLEAYLEGLSGVDVLGFTGAADAELVRAAMSALVNAHEMQVVTGRVPSDAVRHAARHITSLGGGYQRWHDMLDVVSAASPAGGPATTGEIERLQWEWRADHGAPSHEGWNWSVLNEWVENVDDERMRDRLFDTLDFFELN